MPTFTKTIFSESTNGRGIKVSATGTAGTLIHTSASGTTIDEIWAYVYNDYSTDDIELTVEWGGTTDPDDNISVTVPRRGGLVLTIPGLILQNSSQFRAFAGKEDQLIIQPILDETI